MKKYEIFDSYNNKLLHDYPVIEAKTGKEAVMKLIRKKGYSIKNIHRSADNIVHFKAQSFIEKDGRKYKSGNAIWYAITKDH